MDSRVLIEEWEEGHERWPEFLECLNAAAPEQSVWVLGEYYRETECHLIVAATDEEVAGFLRFAVQPIGPELGCPELYVGEQMLTEAKIHAFAVGAGWRRQGIGTALQRRAIVRARERGCYQLRSESSYERVANHALKLRLGFGAQPEARRIGDGIETLVNFVLPLRIDAALSDGQPN